jgi:hypothetical protein
MPGGSAREARGNDRVEVANVEAALEKVPGFIDSTGHPAWRQADRQIHEQLPLILRIAARADPELPAKLKEGS